MEVESVPVESLHLDPANVRKHGPRNLSAIKASLARFGQVKPIVVTAEDVVIAGNGTLQAARELGWEEIQVHRTELEGAEAIAYAVADNRTAELAEWDLEALQDQVRALEPEQMEAAGWTGEELDALALEAMDGGGEGSGSGDGDSDGDGDGDTSDGSDDVPAPPKVPTSIEGDVWTLGRHTLYCGDSADILRGLESDTFDSVLTDPPYGLAFMGKGWDKVLPDESIWREALRVSKPGAIMVAFGGTRTYHRLAVNIEDVGWELRDCLAWMYGSGFPKSLDVSKAIDRQRYDREEVLQVTNWIADAVKRSGKTHAQILSAFGFNRGSGQVGHWTARTNGSQPSVPTIDQVPQLLDLLGVEPPEDIRRLIWDLNGMKGQPGENWAKREVVGTKKAGIANPEDRDRHTIGGSSAVEVDITTPATDAAKLWDGWGTALKPAWEPGILAMKPTEGTFAENAEKWGVAGLNVEGGRIGADPITTQNTKKGFGAGAPRTATGQTELTEHLGRWPANVALDEDAAGVLDEQAGAEPSRFFYTAKASRSDRGEGNDHPTVKPSSLMRWLARLTATPTGGTVLEPFCGSGTTLIACEHEGRDCTGIEREPAFADVIVSRWEAVSGEEAIHAGTGQTFAEVKAEREA